MERLLVLNRKSDRPLSDRAAQKRGQAVLTALARSALLRDEASRCPPGELTHCLPQPRLDLCRECPKLLDLAAEGVDQV